ncbi:MAG: ATP-binding protein [Candidatus Ornithospirochaeta sp.]|nr:ATP-binding protein [Candidatus Ornithospirochaeta sp.]
MEIARDKYLNRLISKKHNGLVKVITGIRRSGKSYLLFNIFYKHLLLSGVSDDHIIRIAFDSYENKEYRDPKVLFPFLSSRIQGNGMHYVLLDEVQLLEDFESVLNSLIRKDNVDVYVTGSNARFLSNDIITEFRGRGDEIRIFPLTFAEYMSVYPGSKEQGWKEYILFGGLPMIMSLPSPEEKTDFLKSLFRETYLLDIIGRNRIRNRSELEDILSILASSIGSLTNPNRISATFESVNRKIISPVTIKRYIECLEDAFLVRSALRYDVKGRRYIGTPSKYYFTDLGIRNAIIGFRQTEQTHAMENAIFNELCARGFNVDVGVVVSNGKDKEGKSIRKANEIDFVCTKGFEKYYIQAAYALADEEKMKQEKRSLLLSDDGFRKIIITRDSVSGLYSEDGILFIDLFDFLLDPECLLR